MPRIPTNQYEDNNEYWDDEMIIDDDIPLTNNGTPRKPPRQDREWEEQYRSERNIRRREE